jgi:urease gamma subunit
VQKRLARGLKLNYPEATALIASQLHEFIRDGKTVAELADMGRRILGRRQVLPDVPDLLTEIQVRILNTRISHTTRPAAIRLFGNHCDAD